MFHVSAGREGQIAAASAFPSILNDPIFAIRGKSTDFQMYAHAYKLAYDKTLGQPK